MYLQSISKSEKIKMATVLLPSCPKYIFLNIHGIYSTQGKYVT